MLSTYQIRVYNISQVLKSSLQLESSFDVVNLNLHYNRNFGRTVNKNNIMLSKLDYVRLVTFTFRQQLNRKSISNDAVGYPLYYHITNLFNRQ